MHKIDLDDALNIANNVMLGPAFSALPGMAYLLIDRNGRPHGRGRIESVDEEWGPFDNGAPIDDYWLPDVRDERTFKMCLKMYVLKVQDPFEPFNN